jgi:hypothetical protein
METWWETKKAGDDDLSIVVTGLDSRGTAPARPVNLPGRSVNQYGLSQID